MKCYRSGGCGPYEQVPCSECPASHPEYLTHSEKALTAIKAIQVDPTKREALIKDLQQQLDKAPGASHLEPPKQEPAGEYIKKDRVIALIHKHFSPVVYSSHDPQWCSKCGALAYWNSHFQGWYCSACGSIYKPPKVDRPEVKELIEVIQAEPDT